MAVRASGYKCKVNIPTKDETATFTVKLTDATCNNPTPTQNIALHTDIDCRNVKVVMGVSEGTLAGTLNPEQGASATLTYKVTPGTDVFFIPNMTVGAGNLGITSTWSTETVGLLARPTTQYHSNGVAYLESGVITLTSSMIRADNKLVVDKDIVGKRHKSEIVQPYNSENKLNK